MGRIGLSEILVIVLLAVIFIQPKDLLQFVRKVGRAYQQMKNMRDEFVNSIRNVEEEIRKSTAETAGTDERTGTLPRSGT